MAVKYSEKAIESISGKILRAKAGDQKAREIIVQEMDAESIAALTEACRSRDLFGRIGWSVYKDIGDLADRLFTVEEIARYAKITGVDTDGYIKLSVGFSGSSAMKEAYLLAIQGESQKLMDFISSLKSEFVSKNELLMNSDFEDIAFRTKEDEEAYIARRQVFSGELQRWREDFENEVRLSFGHMRDGITGENAVVRTKPSKYKSPVYIAVHRGGKVIEWVYRDGAVSMSNSDGVSLHREKMKPVESWFEGASSSAAKEYIADGGTFTNYLPKEA